MLFRNPKFLISSALFLLAAPVAAQVTTFPDDVVIEGDLTVDAGTTGSMYVEGGQRHRRLPLPWQYLPADHDLRE